VGQVRTSRGIVLRWLPPVVAAAAVAAVVTVPAALNAAPKDVVVAPKSLEAVDADLLLEQDASHSGTIRATANLGLPDLPASSLGGLGTVTALLTGTHTLRYWQLGASRQRLAILDTLAETDLLRIGSAFGTYDSHQNTASRLTAPRVNGKSTGTQRISQILTSLVTPGDTTAVHLGEPVSIAGRTAYALDLVPRQAGTLVDHVEIAVDTDRGTALRIRVYAKGVTAPAFEMTYTAISYRPPSASLFDLLSTLPPIGASARPAALVTPAPANPGTGITTTGTGWATIVRVPLGQLGGTLGRSLNRLTDPVPEGRILRTRLLTALLTPAGVLWVGAVPADALVAAARG
jgi:hypothetical protein